MPMEDACDITLLYVKRFEAENDRPIAVWTEPKLDVPTNEGLDTFLRANPKYRNDPELPLLRRLASVRQISAVERCPRLKEWLTKTNTLHDDDRMYDEIADHEIWPFAALAMSLPAVSEDGTTALMYTAEYYGPLAGATYFVRYKKDSDGSWVWERADLSGIS